MTPAARRKRRDHLKAAVGALLIAGLAVGYVAFARSPELQDLLRLETVRAA